MVNVSDAEGARRFGFPEARGIRGASWSLPANGAWRVMTMMFRTALMLSH